MVEVINPATEEVIERVDSATAEETDAAIDRARAAFPGWRDVEPADRALLLRRLAEALEVERENLVRLESRNVGKPVAGAQGEIDMGVQTFGYYAGAPERLLGETIPVSGGVNMTFREPLGVVGLIVPWNFPLQIASWKMAPALAAGNPEGVVNVVVGPGSEVGQRLAEHPDVAKVAFTGSTEVGRKIMAAAAGTIKRVTLELGGKSASVVFADADLERAASAAPAAVFDNAGQDCCARSRILVERSVFDDFLDLLRPAVENFRVGDPFDEATEMGPLISADHREKVASFVTDDAPVAIRGSAPDGPGFWYPPTVLAPVSNDDRAAREEI